MPDARTAALSSPTPAGALPGAPPAFTPREQMMQLLCGGWIVQSIATAARLGIADQLARAPQTADELASHARVLPDRLERLLRALASLGIFTRRADGTYENTPLSAELRTGGAASLNAMARMHAEEQYVAWSRFHEALTRRTTAFELQYGEHVFSWYAKHPAQARTFNEAMSDYSSGQIEAVARAYDTSSAKLIVDVGGGHGQLLLALLARAPQARGVVFDLEQGLAAARATGVDRDPRVQLVAGDFFAGMARGGDLYVLKFILHDWDDEQCVTILRHISANMARGGKVLLVEQLVAPDNVPDPAKWLDLHMLVMTGGRERTEAEFAQLFARAGLALARVTPTPAGVWLVEAALA